MDAVNDRRPWLANNAIVPLVVSVFVSVLVSVCMENFMLLKLFVMDCGGIFLHPTYLFLFSHNVLNRSRPHFLIVHHTVYGILQPYST